MPQAISQIAELAEADSSLTVTQTPFVVPGPLTLSLLQGRWSQRIVASQYLIGDARKPVDVGLGQHVIDHEFHQISRGERRRGPTARSLKGPQTGSRSEEHTSELQSLAYLVCRLLLEKKKETQIPL